MLVMTPGFLFLQKYINILIVTTKKPFFFAFSVISFPLKHFSIISYIFQKKSVSLQKISCTRQSESKLSLRSLA